jgi:hypothetical protein
VALLAGFALQSFNIRRSYLIGVLRNYSRASLEKVSVATPFDHSGCVGQRGFNLSAH